jgi:hypothetical protein
MPFVPPQEGNLYQGSTLISDNTYFGFQVKKKSFWSWAPRHELLESGITTRQHSRQDELKSTCCQKFSRNWCGIDRWREAPERRSDGFASLAVKGRSRQHTRNESDKTLGNLSITCVVSGLEKSDYLFPGRLFSLELCRNAVLVCADSALRLLRGRKRRFVALSWASVLSLKYLWKPEPLLPGPCEIANRA